MDQILRAIYEEFNKETANLSNINSATTELEGRIFKEAALQLEKDGYLLGVKKATGGQDNKVLTVWFDSNTSVTRKGASRLTEIL
ncbi:hypothetical protein [Ectobacillus funiculus]|uniref:Uncharacterized protein n=1 Tax=Ectobacillus funiculus TaxID=137993 RepID=A0ABV5W9J4_9BACI|nr:hypothetical protein [Ectobacillus funiculus]